MNVIDLFSGCGGLSYGFIKNGFSVNKAVEFDPNIAKTYIMNHPDVDMIVDDIKNIDQSGVFIKGDADVIIGVHPAKDSQWPERESVMDLLMIHVIIYLNITLM